MSWHSKNEATSEYHCENVYDQKQSLKDVEDENQNENA